jgi:hypothetical protein
MPSGSQVCCTPTHLQLLLIQQLLLEAAVVVQLPRNLRLNHCLLCSAGLQLAAQLAHLLLWTASSKVCMTTSAMN